MQTEQFQLHSRMEETHWWFTGRRKIIRRLVHQVLPPSAGGTLVDVGCGTGGNLAAFTGEYDCLGWDPSEEAIRLARLRFPESRFHSGSLSETLASLPVPPDLILLLDVLEHIEEDTSFFAQMADALRPGGYLLITVPAGMELWSPHDVTFGHFRRYSRPELERLWEREPLSTLLLSHYNSRLYPVVRCIRFWTQRRGQAMGEGQSDFRVPPSPVNRLLERILSAEADALVHFLKQERRQGFSRGVSLIALLQKQEGPSYAF